MEKPQKICKFFVTRKKRNCRMYVKEGEEYCGEHLKPKDIQEIPEEDKKSRVVCPLDRTHTCYAHKLNKHLKICNARQSKVEPYIEKGINSGKFEDSVEDSFKFLSTYSVSDILETIKKVNKVYEDHVNNQITDKILSEKNVEDEMTKPEYGDKTKKHLKQASSILGLLFNYDLVKPNTCYIEFGAGRGQLTYWISKSTENLEGTCLLLVERASPKHKRDNKLAKTTEVVQRIRADISDLVLDKLEVINKTTNVVGVTKHLCGEATDLAIRCLTNVKENQNKVQGAIMTFCCHHRCRWTSYVGKDFFMKNELTKEDFEIVCGLTSWATCGSGISREKRNMTKKEKDNEIKDTEVKEEIKITRDVELGLNREEKECVGRKSKNVLNWGRLEHMQEKGYNCYLHHYIDKSISLENVCIVACKNNKL